jgi:drug/metabolite transporter (DMT)-like permease
MIGSETQAHPLRGVLLIMAAVLVFACMDAATKHMATRYNVPMVVAIRYIVNLGLLVVIFGPKLGRGLYSTNRIEPDWSWRARAALRFPRSAQVSR